MSDKKEQLKEDVDLQQKGEMGFEDDFDHPYHITFDVNGNKIYDGHSLLHKDTELKK